MKKGFTNLKEVKKTEQRNLLLDILNAIDFFCKENNIMYFLYFGTLLGAVRHHGFIPWDDDLDIAMPRPDYERFISEFKSDGLYLFNYHTHKKMLMPFTKVCSDRTVGYYENNVELPYGLSIDVFPIDGYPNTEQDAKAFHKKMSMIFNKKFDRGLFWELTNYGESSFIQRILKKILHPLFKSSKWAKVIDKNACLYDYNLCSQVKTNITFWGVSPKKSFSKENVLSVVNLPFENKFYPCPIGYDAVLQSCYGPNYMTPPPLDKRVSTHQLYYYWK